MKALQKEKDQLKKLEDDLARRKAERKAKVQAYLAEVMKKGVGAGSINAMNAFENRLKDEEAQVALDIERQKESVRQAEDTLEIRRQEMAEAAKEKKAIEKHKDTWTKEVRKERMAKEEMNQEEIGNSLHLARTRREDKS